MDATKKRIDKVLSETSGRVQEEVGSLLGVELTVTPVESVIHSKEEIFDNLTGKQVFAHVDFSGDIEGVGGLVLGLKGAIRLGGTLIMLPPAELDEVVGREDYSEELDDSYGEIANIIAGSYTKVFEEMYPKKFRFIRKELEILQPINVQPESDEPIPDQPYYSVGCSLTLDKVDLGFMYMLMPAVAFGLVEDVEAPPEPEEEVVKAEATETQPEQESSGQEAVTEPVVEEKKPINKEKHQKRVIKILAECGDRLTEEVSALTGAQITFGEFETAFISKEDFFFEEVDGKQVMANLDVTGDNPGNSYLYFGLKSAIHLGGTLIMLPPAELENTCSAEDFSEDINDAYGEITNIITGAISLVFEEQYPEQIRFIKTDIEQVIPMKVDVDSDDPIPNQQYFMMSLAATADGKELGKLRLLFPDTILHLEPEEKPPEQPEQPKGDESAATVQEPPPQPEAASETAGPQEDSEESSFDVDPDFDLDKQQKRVDRILEECRSRTQAEVGELLGAEIKLDQLDNRPVSKEDFFFDELSGKQVIANMDVVGDAQGKSYLFVSLKDAIHTGGVLIMLPSAELEKTVAEEEFNDDTGDAYGEIANIISGVYTAVFEEQYSQSLRFIKTDLTQVVPMKVDPESDEPVPDEPYYMSGMALTIGGEKKGKIHMLFPAKLLQLEMLGREEELAAAQAAAIKKQEATEAGGAGATAAAAGSDQALGQAAASPASGVVTPVAPAAAPISYEPADILLISDDEAAASLLAAGAGAKGFRVRRIGYNDDIRSALTSELRIVYLVMREVNEQAFGIAINVRASSTLPLVAAGPAWTRSKVIKAVKYGVSDILLTPATAEDVDENMSNNLAQMAA